jgi:predicted methyltransferase MtxX (methanogen marker protein 4)
VTSDQRTGVILALIVLAFFSSVIVAVTYSGRMGDLEETKRIQDCIAAGKMWVDMEPDNGIETWSCVDKGTRIPK